MKTPIPFLTAALLLLSCATPAAAIELIKGKATLSATSPFGDPVTITVRTSKFKKNALLQDLMEEGYTPKVIISDIEIMSGKVKIPSPVHVRDLVFDPSDVSLERAGNLLKLSIIGGDGAHAYTMEIHIDSRHVMRKKRLLTQFPDQYEDTFYHYDETREQNQD